VSFSEQVQTSTIDGVQQTTIPIMSANGQPVAVVVLTNNNKKDTKLKSNSGKKDKCSNDTFEKDVQMVSRVIEQANKRIRSKRRKKSKSAKLKHSIDDLSGRL
jgi:ABC-type bacteriocin/lantibiotic exporter with double-glycine peptidase domain